MAALKCKEAASQNADNMQSYKTVKQVPLIFRHEINVCQLFQFTATLQRGGKGIYYEQPSVVVCSIHIFVVFDRIPVRKHSCPAMCYVIIL